MTSSSNGENEGSHQFFFTNPGGFGYGVTQRRHQFPNFPEIYKLKNHSIILYTYYIPFLMPEPPLSLTYISHEQLKISQKTNRIENQLYLEFFTSTKFLAGGVKVIPKAVLSKP
jgi:hypothetical protein